MPVNGRRNLQNAVKPALFFQALQVVGDGLRVALEHLGAGGSGRGGLRRFLGDFRHRGRLVRRAVLAAGDQGEKGEAKAAHRRIIGVAAQEARPEAQQDRQSGLRRWLPRR